MRMNSVDVSKLSRMRILSACVLLLLKSSSSADMGLSSDIRNPFKRRCNVKSAERWNTFACNVFLMVSLAAHRIYLQERVMSPVIMTLNAIDSVFRSHTIYLVSFVCFFFRFRRHINDVKRVRERSLYSLSLRNVRFD